MSLLHCAFEIGVTKLPLDFCFIVANACCKRAVTGRRDCATWLPWSRRFLVAGKCLTDFLKAALREDNSGSRR
jgi:hypothetical protein